MLTTTKRESEVIAGLLAGKSNREIGSDLGITERTVKSRIENLSKNLRIDRTKFLVRNRIVYLVLTGEVNLT